MPDFRILDKDLDRLSNAQSARAQAAGPVVRLGIAVVFVAVAALALWGGGPLGPAAPAVLIAAAAAAGAFLALSIGANDVANALGPAVGAGALLRRNLLCYGLGGVIAPFIGIKLIDIALDPLLRLVGIA